MSDNLLRIWADENTPQPTRQQKEIYDRNSPYIADGMSQFATRLAPLKELEFQKWVNENRVPFDVRAPISDYDMRGFYLGLMNGNPRALSAINPNDNRMHYPDYWKTPYHETFSNESQWAAPTAPQWNSLDQLVAPSGKIIFDERARRK